MSGRNATAAVLAELIKGEVRVAHLFELELDDATVRNSDAFRDVDWNGNTYVANGHFMDFTSIEETADLRIARATFSLSGIDQTQVAGVLQHTYIDRVIRAYKAFFNTDEALIADPMLIFDGRIDSTAVDDDPTRGTSSVVLTATSAWVDFERRPGRHTNHEEQQIHFPGDRGFQYATAINRQIVWGRK